VIFNPSAGQRRRRRLARVLALLREGGCAVETYETQARGDAEAHARGLDPRTFDAVVVAGGDGTINEVMNGLAGIPLPLGIVPLGTANVLAAEIGLGLSPRAVARAIAAGSALRVFPGIVNGRSFAMMAGVGFDARVVAGVDPGLKRWAGKAAYVASTLAAFARHIPAAYDVTIDSKPYRAASVVIAKGHYYGGRFVVAPDARLDEPVFHVALFAGGGRGDILRYAAALGLDRVASLADVRVIAGREVRIAGPAGEGVQVDGDLAARLPLVATIAPAPIAILR
jgi:diacylglycerol kinase (ATP)